MKNAYYAIIGLSILIVGQVLAQTVETQTDGPLTIKWYSASLPKEGTAQTQGISWPVASANWMEIIRTEALSKGKNRLKAEKVNFCDYAGMLTSDGFNSWRGVSESPSQESGNRQYFGFKVYCQTGSFTPSNITCSVVSEVWGGTTKDWQPDNLINGSPTMASNGNTFRLRLDAGPNTDYGDYDDVLASSQVMTVGANCFIYGGFGIGLGGTSQGQLDSALNYMKGNHLRVKLTVRITHSSSSSPYIFTTVYMPPMKDVSDLNPAYYSPGSGEGHGHLRWTGKTGLVYEVKKSTNLIDWTHLSYTDAVSEELSEENDGTEPKCFYRINGY